MKSIRRYLSRTLALVLAGATLLTVTAAYLITAHETEEILDAQLSLQGRVVASLIGPDTSTDDFRRIAERLSQPGHLARFYHNGEPTLGETGQVAALYHHEERELSLGFWQRDGSPLLMGSPWSREGAFPAPDEEGYAWVAYDGGRWRVFSMFDDNSGLWIRSGVSIEFMQELERKVALGNLVPMLLALPLLLVAMGWIVRRGLIPIGTLSREVAGRGERELGFIDVGVPRELTGLRKAINDFIARLRETLERERRFTADAAHELRTPLAGLKIHLDNARAGEKDSLDKAYRGVERLQRVVEQLLVLARLDRRETREARNIDLYPLVLELVAELWPWAQARQQEMTLHGAQALWVRADPVEVGILIRNLLDNALRYTPEHGEVAITLSETPGGAVLSVRDSGPGIPEEALATITERFRRAADQRTTGSGLGLSIVKQLAERQQARLTLRNCHPHGLEAALCWPAVEGDGTNA
ncbi:sensor histidine kinase [Halomonas getboli]|uniref:sensor histidine kinase n=1 Tax=Halomonas getboli TaxID=2935862 RepID=UPI001FFFF26B|nr:ATP-binding protein [Halomonas getboli]MCK2184186.1 ATP-binding protein [Halomonas getboli]